MNSLLRHTIGRIGCVFWMLCVFQTVGAVYAQSPSGATQSATQAAMATPTPQPTAFPTPAIEPTPASTSIIEGESSDELTQFEIEQIKQWEKQNGLGNWTFWGAVAAILIAFWRAQSFYQQTREQMLASYRERLFKNDPGEVIAAAMSLSKYPTEAIWLVMRFAQQYKKEKEITKQNAFANIEDPYQILQAIKDALGNMSEQYSIVYLAPKWFKKISYLAWIKFPYKMVRGARLDGMTISIEIGPVRLPHAYLVEADLSYVGLAGADLIQANLQGAKLQEANLQGAYLRKANLQKSWIEAVVLSYSLQHNANLDKHQKISVNKWNDTHGESSESPAPSP